VSLFFSIVTLFLSLTVVIIAGLQWRAADNKLRLDLFDRRYKVYDATRNFVAIIIKEATFTDSQLVDFNIGTSDAKFLFGPDVEAYLAEIRKRAVHMRTARQLLEKQQVSDENELSRHTRAEYDDLLWLCEQITAMTKNFAPYIGFANIRSRIVPFVKFFSKSR
jgi:hypothetical protein